MSHSQGAVRFPDGVIKWVEYNGTVDVLHMNLFDTQEILMNNWRSESSWRYKVCTCNNPLEPVQIAVTYGSGYYWDGWACRTCMVVSSPLEPHWEDDNGNYHSAIDGLPNWYPNKQDYE